MPVVKESDRYTNQAGVRFGLIGVGHIGAPLASDLRRSGHDFMVYDCDSEVLQRLAGEGIASASSPKELAKSADLIGVCVRTGDEVYDAVLGPQGVVASGRNDVTVAVHSTIPIHQLREIAAAASAAGVQMIDAPVSRGPGSPAQKGVIYMVGGAPDDVERFAPYFDASARIVMKAGPLGMGMATKLCNNLIYYVNMMMSRDISRFAEHFGIDCDSLAEVLTENGATTQVSLALRRKSGEALPNQIRYISDQTIVELGQKDLECVSEAVQGVGLELPILDLARRGFSKSMLGVRT